jgi:GNAT superfamily N-acetyltransferase
MLLGGGYDVQVYSLAPATFWAAFVDECPIGVNSGHPTSQTEFRCRGLYVHKALRKNGIGAKLLRHGASYAQKCGYKRIWSAPRKSALEIYKRCGFKIVSGELGEGDGFEFGPNFYAILDLEQDTNLI